MSDLVSTQPYYCPSCSAVLTNKQVSKCTSCGERFRFGFIKAASSPLETPLTKIESTEDTQIKVEEQSRGTLNFVLCVVVSILIWLFVGVLAVGSALSPALGYGKASVELIFFWILVLPLMLVGVCIAVFQVGKK